MISRGMSFVSNGLSIPRLLLILCLASWVPVTCSALNAQEHPDHVASPHGTAKFLNSSECALCHSFSSSAQAMRDAKNRNVAPYDLWSGSMMANSARDPYWRAVLSAEVVTTPLQKAHIEDICTRCHAPMASPVKTSPAGEILAFLREGHSKQKLASDGVSCTVCHQISEEKLGSDESFTGGFVFNSSGMIYGPHANPVTMPMQRHVGFTPTKSEHILSSALCATCHTVITQSFDSHGAETDWKLHEQAPYLEWRNSIFNDELPTNRDTGRSCQNCHSPTTDAEGKTIAARLAHNPGGRDFPFLNARSPFGRHTFAGGNTFMTKLIRDNRKVLGATASVDAFNRVIDESQKMLQTQTAKLRLLEFQTKEQMSTISVGIENLSGHKFPTAYPSRRAWIELAVTNDKNQVVFASGRVNQKGQLIDQYGSVLSSEIANGPIQPHTNRISESKQVQIYESKMADSDSKPTYALLRGSVFLKDNRLLPKGWSFDHSDAKATAPAGVGDDLDFVAGEDRVQYHMSLPKGKYSLAIKLRFQSLSTRYIAELFEIDTAEIEEFRRMYLAADQTPETIDSISADLVVE